MKKCVLTILELNWNQLWGHKRAKLNICHHMLTSSTQLQNSAFHVVERTRRSSKCQKMKNTRAKRAKILIFIVKCANLWGFLLPSSSWLLRLPFVSIVPWWWLFSLFYIIREFERVLNWGWAERSETSQKLYDPESMFWSHRSFIVLIGKRDSMLKKIRGIIAYGNKNHFKAISTLLVILKPRNCMNFEEILSEMETWCLLLHCALCLVHGLDMKNLLLTWLSDQI